jgi:hypothetical protein
VNATGSATVPKELADAPIPGASLPSRALRLALAAASCFLVALPFLAVTFPPIADLPQHVAQIPLFFDALQNPDSLYRIQWLIPYSLSYVVIGAAWILSAPESAGRIAFIVVGLLWTVTAHALAGTRRRCPEAAVLASVLYFNHSLYWGFLSFLSGWPAFALWFCLVSRRRSERFRWFDVPLFLGGGVLLYLSHALWLVAGAIWFVVASLVLRAPLRPSILRFASFAPALAAVILWARQVAAAGFTSATLWDQGPLGRLSPFWLVDAVLGGVRGPLENVMVALLAMWVLLSLWQGRRNLAQTMDRELLLAAGLLSLWVFILPYKHSNTIHFASRWASPAFVMLLLALPAPALPAAVRRGTALVVLAVFVLATAQAWRYFERTECAGLEQVLSALPAGQRVIGLDLVKTSEVIKGRPFLQMFAYAQVRRGGELNFSFADFPPALVVYKARRHPQWTIGLEWFGENVQLQDLAHFDYAVVNGEESEHARAAAVPELVPVTAGGRWRLYRVGGARP